ncbi:MAG: DUF2065 domain-containing protein [Gammaproteobacteria bacterium]
MWDNLLTAFALVLVIEGLMPFLNPAGWRRIIAMTAQLDDSTLRVIGLTSMILGVFLLYLVH